MHSFPKQWAQRDLLSLEFLEWRGPKNASRRLSFWKARLSCGPENSAEQSQDWYTQLGGIFIRISSPGEEADMVFFALKKHLCGGACLCIRHRNLTWRGILPISRCAVLFQNMEACIQNTENTDRKFQWHLKLDFFQKFLKSSCSGKVAKH